MWFQFLVAESHGEFIVEIINLKRLLKKLLYEKRSFSPIPEDDANSIFLN